MPFEFSVASETEAANDCNFKSLEESFWEEIIELNYGQLRSRTGAGFEKIAVITQIGYLLLGITWNAIKIKHNNKIYTFFFMLC
jgi:hypothetical protein